MQEISVGAFHPFEVTAVHLIYVGLGFFIVIFGMLSLFIKEKLYLGEAPIAALFGIIVGPVAIGLFNPSHWANNESRAPGGHITNEITLEVMRVTIALSVFAVGVELPKKYLLRHWKSIAMLLGPVMIWGWFITGLLIWGLIPGLDFLNALLVAAAVTPTDPILAQAVVGGPWAEQHVPAHLRHMLMCESGCNDGAAFPFMFLALFLTTNRDNTGKAIGEWFYDAILYQIVLGTLLGALIGWAARKAMRFSERHKLIDRESFVAQYVSLAIASMGVGVLLGSDDLLGAFACGTAFAWDGWFTRQTEDSNFSNIVDLLFNVAAFIYVGALMPFGTWVDASIGLSIWRLIVLAILVLLLKRIPIVLALWKWIPDIKSFREAVFSAHFAPIGCGAVFIATLARTQLPEEVPYPPVTSNEFLAYSMQPIIFFLVLCSILVHGLTIPFFAFSRHATTITRTWSRHASFGGGEEGGEPGWMNRVRRFRTNDTLKHEEGNMSEIERVLNAQIIGRGAIGGDAEKEMRREETSTSSPPTTGSDSSNSGKLAPLVGMLSPGRKSTERDLEKQDDMIDDPEDYFDDDAYGADGGEWGGDNTIEAKRWRAQRRAEREAKAARERGERQSADGSARAAAEAAQHDSESGDIGGAPMDRDLHAGRVEADVRAVNAEDRDAERQRIMTPEEEGAATCGDKTKYPLVRSWLEGHDLVLEYQAHKSSDPEVHVLNLTDADVAAIEGSDSPALAWSKHHGDRIEHHLGITEHREWDSTEAIKRMLHHDIPKRYNAFLASQAEGKSREEAEQAAHASASPRGRRGSAARQGGKKNTSPLPGMQRRESVVESRAQRDERASMMYGAHSWAMGNRRDLSPTEAQHAEASSAMAAAAASPTVASDSSGSRSPRRGSARNASTSPRRSEMREKPAKPALHTTRPAGATAGRRPSLRKRLLAGQVDFRGRRGDTPGDEFDEEEEDEDSGTSSGYRPPSIFIGNAARPESMPASPRGGVPARYLPRTDSAGGLGEEDSSHQRSSSVQWLNINDESHNRAAPALRSAPGSAGRATGRDSRPGSRSASPSRAAGADRHSKVLNRNRTISNASMRADLQLQGSSASASTAVEPGADVEAAASSSPAGKDRKGKNRIAGFLSSLGARGTRNADTEDRSTPPPAPSALSSLTPSRFASRPPTADSNGGTATPASDGGILHSSAASEAGIQHAASADDRVMFNLPSQSENVPAGKKKEP